jgi:hypothetical protein
MWFGICGPIRFQLYATVSMFNSIVMLIVTFNLFDLIIILDTPKDSLLSIFHSVTIFFLEFLSEIRLGDEPDHHGF